jgi:hypothetical protein
LRDLQVSTGQALRTMSAELGIMIRGMDRMSYCSKEV